MRAEGKGYVYFVNYVFNTSLVSLFITMSLLKTSGRKSVFKYAWVCKCFPRIETEGNSQKHGNLAKILSKHNIVKNILIQIQHIFIMLVKTCERNLVLFFLGFTTIYFLGRIYKGHKSHYLSTNGN